MLKDVGMAVLTTLVSLVFFIVCSYVCMYCVLQVLLLTQARSCDRTLDHMTNMRKWRMQSMRKWRPTIWKYSKILVVLVREGSYDDSVAQGSCTGEKGIVLC